MRRSDRERKMVVEITNMGIIAVFFFCFFFLDPMITVGYQSEVKKEEPDISEMEPRKTWVMTTP